MNQSRSCHELDAELPLRLNSLENYGAALQRSAVLGLEKADAQILIAHVLGCSRATLLAFPERSLTAEQAQAICALLARRCLGEPVAYLTEQQEFYGLKLAVGPACLIPRADTETLVEYALTRFPDRAGFSTVDLGTGSGAIALALKANRPHWQVHACDRSAEALALAKQNAQALNLSVHFHLGHWFSPLLGHAPFELIVSNPPYIAQHDPHLAQGDLRFEPPQALSAGAEGLDDLRQLIAEAPAHLVPGGCLMLEHGYQQAEAVQQLLFARGFNRINSIKDLAGNWRISSGYYGELP